jgi:hypothetical protein
MIRVVWHAARLQRGFVGTRGGWLLNQWLRHLHKMAWKLGIQAGGQWRGASFDVSAVMVELRQFVAKVDDLDIPKVAIRLAAMILRRGHQLRSYPGLLSFGVDSQQAEIRAAKLHFDVDTARDDSLRSETRNSPVRNRD